MKGTIQLFKIQGIPICVHWSFSFVLVWVFFTAYSYETGLNSMLLKINALSILTLFSIVILHELGHALVARRLHIATTKIVLLPLGGVAMLENQSFSPKKDLLISLAGPMTNFALVLLFLPLLWVFPESVIHQMVEVVLHPQHPLIMVSHLNSFQWFVFLFILVNLSIAVFNLIPALPLDGGRILKAILAMRMEELSAVTYTVWIGNILALAVMTYGFWTDHFLFIVLGAYVIATSSGIIKRAKILEILKKTTVGEILIPVDDFLRANGQNPNEETWNFSDAPYDISTSTPLNVAVDLMLKEDVQFIPVVEDGEVKGILSLSVINTFIGRF